MPHIHQDLSQRIHVLEKELQTALKEKEQAFGYHWTRCKTRFEGDVLTQHGRLKAGLLPYIFSSRILAVLSAPVIYLGIVPFWLLDLFLALFQAVYFPVYEIPTVQRADYIIFDRGHLKYLNGLERLNCVYCSYANGLFAYATEIAARTEQHWCPIKHAQRLRAPHSRYQHFFDYGDAQRYQKEVTAVRSDFVDLRSVTSAKPDAGSK